jgi:hypothetical protein
MAMCLFPKPDGARLIFAPVAYRQRERFRILSQVGFGVKYDRGALLNLSPHCGERSKAKRSEGFG